MHNPLLLKDTLDLHRWLKQQDLIAETVTALPYAEPQTHWSEGTGSHAAGVVVEWLCIVLAQLCVLLCLWRCKAGRQIHDFYSEQLSALEKMGYLEAVPELAADIKED